MSALDALFSPTRVAVLGVSRNPAKLGHVLLKNVLGGGFPGEVFVVNPSGEPILERPSVRGVDALPRGIDLALVSLPPEAVLAAITGLAARGTRMAVILTSGFGEVGERGRAEQSALLQAARAGGLRLVGPNCMGVYSRPASLNGTYFWELPRLDGGIGVVSQSGAYGGLIMRHLGGAGLGVSRFLSIGNQVDLDIAEALDYLATDEATRLVACFIEAVPDGRRFVEAARRVTRAKPMVVLKGGRGEAGRRAAGSHTGSLAGTVAIYEAAFRGAGIVACAETEEFFDAIQVLATVALRPRQPTLAIVTVSGGPSVIAADAAEALGLSVPALSPAVQADLRKLLPAFAAVGNPVDMTPQVEPARIGLVAARVLAEETVAGALAVNVGLDIEPFAHGVLAAARAAAKPLVACSVDAPMVVGTLRAAGVPVYRTPERAVRAYRALWLATERPDDPAPRPPRPGLSANLAALLSRAHGPLPYAAARELLSAYGIRFCRERRAASVDEAVGAAEALGFPVVLKSAAPGLLHKTEAGGVSLDLRDAAAVAQACRTMAARLGDQGFVLQEQVPAGIELLVGGRRDDSFGPVVAAGTGGFFAEALRDVSLGLAPLGPDEAQALVVQGLRGRLLGGYRGLPVSSGKPAAVALVAIGRLLEDEPSIREVDVNPLIVRGEDAVAVDALVILR